MTCVQYKVSFRIQASFFGAVKRKIYSVLRTGLYSSVHYCDAYGIVLLHSKINTDHPFSYDVTAPWTADTKRDHKRNVNCGFDSGSPFHALLTIICSYETLDTEISLLSTLTVPNHTSQKVTFTQFRHVQQFRFH